MHEVYWRCILSIAFAHVPVLCIYMHILYSDSVVIYSIKYYTSVFRGYTPFNFVEMISIYAYTLFVLYIHLLLLYLYT